jgi:hypothetical protein
VIGYLDRVRLVARGLGRRGWNLMSLALGDSGTPPMPYYQT